jgi:hypothetical protein
MGYFDMVEQCWELSEAARDYVKSSARDVTRGEVWEQVFTKSALVDIDRTLRESPQLDRIYLKTPYGLEYRAEHNDWIPFRHSVIDLTDNTNI